jgi:hypothetical protein
MKSQREPTIHHLINLKLATMHDQNQVFDYSESTVDEQRSPQSLKSDEPTSTESNRLSKIILTFEFEFSFIRIRYTIAKIKKKIYSI